VYEIMRDKVVKKFVNVDMQVVSSWKTHDEWLEMSLSTTPRTMWREHGVYIMMW